MAQQPKKEPHFRNYNPGILDFLARANTEDECKELIDYLQSKGEISEEEANHYHYLLKNEGPSVFGTRLPGYYDSEKES